MPSDGLCFVCRIPLASDDRGMRSIEFVGDAHHEPGRYPAHGGCTIGLRYRWLTRNKDGQLVPVTSRDAPKRPSWYNRIIARFFAWGATKFQPARRFE